MKIDVKLTYKQAVGLKTIGLYVPGLDVAIKEYEELKSHLIECSRKISLIGGYSLVHCPQKDRITNLELLLEPFEHLLNIENASKYFHEEKGTSDRSLLYEDLIGSFERVEFLLEHKDDSLFNQHIESYIKFIQSASYRFKNMIVNDFDLVPADII